MSERNQKNKTIILYSNDLDKALAAFNIAVGAQAMGFDVSIYFTFWGLSILRKQNHKPKGKSFIDRLFGLFLPKGASDLSLSQMHMGGLGTWMMKRVMKKKKVALLPELIKTAQDLGVTLIACQMTLDVMGLKSEELIDGVNIAGVAGYLEAAEQSNVNLFI